jgi:phosphoribosylformylglycinamidine (FGAM) synthase-like amidotransferase family enzyme
MKFGGNTVFPGSNLLHHDAYQRESRSTRRAMPSGLHLANRETEHSPSSDARIISGGFVLRRLICGPAPLAKSFSAVKRFSEEILRAAGQTGVGASRNGFQILCEAGLFAGSLIRQSRAPAHYCLVITRQMFAWEEYAIRPFSRTQLRRGTQIIAHSRIARMPRDSSSRG